MRGLSILEGNCKVLDPNFNYKKTLDPYISDYLIDLKYIENKAMFDFNFIKTFPSKLKEQEIDLDIMRMNAQYDVIEKEKSMKNKTLALGCIVLMMALLENNIVSPFYTMILSAILLL